MSLVNREEEENIIVGIEQIFQKYGLMPDEKMFVLNEVIGRIRSVGEKQKMSDLMSRGISGGLFKNIQKKFFKQEEEDKE